MELNNFVQSESFYKFEKIRRLTLQFWPVQFAAKDRMASAGFYYNFKDDHLICKFCKVVIGDWSMSDDPFVEHRIQSPHCPLINKRLTDNIPVSQKKFNHELKLLNFNQHVRHPDFVKHEDRLKSFENWPPGLKQRPQELSKAGFFYVNIGDQVKCFTCGGCLKNWIETDDPFNEHLNNFGCCKFIQQKLADAERSIQFIENSLNGLSKRKNNNMCLSEAPSKKATFDTISTTKDA